MLLSSYCISSPSLGPILVTLVIVQTVLYLIGILSGNEDLMSSYFLLSALIIQLISIPFMWIYELSKESLAGDQTSNSNYIDRESWYLFILSEALIFTALFFGYFYSIWIGTILGIGYKWLPLGIESIDYLGAPLFGTWLLLTSSTLSSMFILSYYRKDIISKVYLILAILLGLLFLYLEIEEYYTNIFTILDSTYSSYFYVITGLHGIHVLIGLVLLISIILYTNSKYLSIKDSTFISNSILYWQFVDYVWILVYIILYI